MLPAPRISVAFFGITRSLSYTIDSIRSNIFASARGYGDVFVCCHFFHQSTINNPRSGEKGLLVDAYGAYSGQISQEMIQKLKIEH